MERVTKPELVHKPPIRLNSCTAIGWSWPLGVITEDCGVGKRWGDVRRDGATASRSRTVDRLGHGVQCWGSHYTAGLRKAVLVPSQDMSALWSCVLKRAKLGGFIG